MRASDVSDEMKARPQGSEFVSDPLEIPAETAQKSYCADGDSEQVESRNLRRCIEDKAQKFNADGYHVVVLSTLRPGFPSMSSLLDVLFGPTPVLRHHGVFETGTYDEICGVVYLPVFQQLTWLKDRTDASMATFFPNHNAKVKTTDQLVRAIAEAFGAEIKHGWQ